jgi:hypothetical protein
MASSALDEVSAWLNEGKAFEVKFDGDTPTLTEAKGIVKIELKKGETKGLGMGKKKAGRKVPKPQKEFVLKASELLLAAKKSYKVTFGPKETTLRFDLDHYVHIYPDRASVVGFSSLNDPPIALIKELFASIPNVKLLAPMR